MLQKLVPVEYKEQRLLTGKQLAAFYETTPARIRDNFRAAKAKGYFVEGKHYFKLEGNDLKRVKRVVEEALFSCSARTSNPISGVARTVILYTVQGAARHCKMLNTDKAWNAVDLADLQNQIDELRSEMAEIKFAFKELTEALNRNTEVQLSRLERADKLIALADRLGDTPERTQLFLQAANLINGKKLF